MPEPPECTECHESFTVDFGSDNDTGLCHPCAQDEVIRLRARVKELEEITPDMAVAIDKLQKARNARASVMARRKWNRRDLPKVEAEIVAAHKAYAKAHAALIRGREDPQHCICPVAFGGCPVHDKED